MLVYFIAILIWGLIWGFATNAVIENKGYEENWFWWGFFFGFIALIVAATKPQRYEEKPYEGSDDSFHISPAFNNADTSADGRSAVASNGSWKCYCGKINPSYTGTCGCGRTKEWNLKKIEDARKEKAEKEQKEDELINLQRLNEYKKLLDSGIITQEDFDKKKKEILG